MDTLLQDLRYALRLLVKSPGFALVAVASLALGIGANAAMFSVVDRTLLRPLPYPEPERLVLPALASTGGRQGAGIDTITWSFPKYQALRAASGHLFQDVAAFGQSGTTLTGTANPETLRMEVVSAPYFRILGVDAQLGRTFTAAEDSVPLAHPVALVSHELWVRRFNADPALVGRTISLDRTLFTVVGVLPRGFRGLTGRSELWIPMAMAPALEWPEVLEEKWAHWHEAVARLRPGVTLEAARAGMDAVGKRVHEAVPPPGGIGAGDERDAAVVVPLRDARGDPLLRRAMLVLLGAVGFVLLIACANVANLLLARSAARRREVAVRLAIGAGRGRLVRQLLTESVLLALLGAAGGLLVAVWATDVLSALGPERVGEWGIRAVEVLDLRAVGVDGRVLLFTLAVAVLAGLLFGLAPALRATRPELTRDLKEGAGHSERAGASLRALGGRGLLVSAEVALAVVLLAGAGLMLRSFAALRAMDPGFRAERLLTVAVAPLQGKYPDRAAAIALHARLLDRLGALPGVQGVTVDKCTPLSRGCNETIVLGAGSRPLQPETAPMVTFHFAGPDHFRILGIRLLAGRGFTAADREGAPRVAVISRALARELWPGENPVGQKLTSGMGGLEDGEIVGVVDDVQYNGPADAPQPAVYVADLQHTYASAVFLVRTAGDPRALAGAVRRELLAEDPDLPATVRTMREIVSDATSRERYGTSLLSVFAGLALVLAALGIHGVVAYSVARRTRELGVRQALGATPGQLVRLVVGQGAALAAVGLAAGVVAALALTRVLAGLLFGVKPNDPLTLLAISLFLGGAALLAAWLPARRAARVDPMVALRSE
ncbi:MAG TPA: ABC transporter permease [Longimicrobiaceae bacterium]|nr:ABC transporter permease [Longimicrobiaceae bacterium]